jgi:hypothetical protein
LEIKMRIADGGGAAAPAVREMSIAEEVAIMKRHAAEAQRRRQQEQEQRQRTDATNDTATGRRRAEGAIDDYNGKVDAHQQSWAERNRGRFNTLAEAQAAWQAEWDRSEQGKLAKEQLEPYLAEYSGAVQHELRLAAAGAGGDPAAIDAGVAEIRGREGGGTFTDQVLDELVTDAGAAVKGESPELRDAAIATTEALETRDGAAANLQNLLDQRAGSLRGIQNGGLRQ